MQTTRTHKLINTHSIVPVGNWIVLVAVLYCLPLFPVLLVLSFFSTRPKQIDHQRCYFQQTRRSFPGWFVGNLQPEDWHLYPADRHLSRLTFSHSEEAALISSREYPLASNLAKVAKVLQTRFVWYWESGYRQQHTITINRMQRQFYAHVSILVSIGRQSSPRGRLLCLNTS